MKLLSKSSNLALKKRKDSLTSTSKTSENVFIVCFLCNMFLGTIFVWCSEEIIIFLDAVRNQTSNRKCLLESFKRRSKVHQENILGTLVKFRPMRNIFQKLWVNKGFCLQNCHEQMSFATFRRVHSNSFFIKFHSTSLHKISIVTGKLLVISSQHFSCELRSSRTYFLRDISYLSLRL